MGSSRVTEILTLIKDILSQDGGQNSTTNNADSEKAKFEERLKGKQPTLRYQGSKLGK